MFLSRNIKAANNVVGLIANFMSASNGTSDDSRISKSCGLE